MADLTQRLALIVDASGDRAEATFKRIASQAETTSKAAKTSGADVAAAADRVAAARLREADAYGKLSVEEAKLEDLRNRGNASQGQMAAAQERVASAQRRVQSATAEVQKATEAQVETNRRAAESADESGRASENLSGNLKGLAGTIAGLVGGVSLVDYLTDSVRGFMDGARGAQTLANSMNATVEQGGQLSAMFSSLGLSADDLLEIQAEFAATVEASGTGLTALGTELQHNSDGTVNWALSLKDALAELQQIPDATERNRQGFAMFGEEGYKQLSRLVSSGVAVEDAFAQIGFPISEDDVAAVQEYDAAMLELRLTSGELGRTIGRAVVPVLTGLVDVGMAVADVLGAIPGPVALAAGAAVGLSVAMRLAATEGSFLATGLASASAGMTAFTTRMAAATASTVAFRTAAFGASQSLMGLAGGPLGVAMIGVGAGMWAAQAGTDAFRESAAEAAAEMAKNEAALGDMAASSAEMGRRLADEAGVWERLAASRSTAGDALEDVGAAGVNLGGIPLDWIIGAGDALTDSELAAAGYAEEIDRVREEMGEYAAQSAGAQVATKDLNDLIAEGTTTGEEFAGAIRDAALAQREEAATSDLAKAAIEAYNAVTSGAVQATYDLITARYATEDANFAFLDAMDKANAATDDSATSVDEARQAMVDFGGAALGAASQAADAAVEAARQAGTMVTPIDEANIRAQAMVDDLRAKLNTPGLAEGTRAELQGLIDQLVAAQEKGDVNALVTLTGAQEASGEIDAATEDRETTVTVESRNGPAVDSYLDGIAKADRLAIVRVESRNGPAVQDYLQSLALRDRLALIRVESRNGPAVDSYLDSLTRERLAIIRVETRGGPAVDAYLDGLARQVRNATIGVTRGAPVGAMRGGPAMSTAGMYGAPRVAVGTVTLDLELTGRADKTALSRAERGRAHVADIRAYERDNGTGWRRS